MGTSEISWRLTFKHERCVGPDEHRDSAGTASRPPAALRVDGDVAADYNCVAAIPGRGLDPVDGVEERCGGAVAGVLRVDALNVGVAGLGEVVHEVGLGGF